MSLSQRLCNLNIFFAIDLVVPLRKRIWSQDKFRKKDIVPTNPVAFQTSQNGNNLYKYQSLIHMKRYSTLLRT